MPCRNSPEAAGELTIRLRMDAVKRSFDSFETIGKPQRDVSPLLRRRGNTPMEFV